MLLVKAKEVWFLAEAIYKDELDIITGRTTVKRLFDAEEISVRDSDIETLPEDYLGIPIDSVGKALSYIKMLDTDPPKD